MACSNQTKLGRIMKIILTLLIISMQFQIAISKPTSSLSEINFEDPQKTHKNTEVLKEDSFNLLKNEPKNQNINENDILITNNSKSKSTYSNERHKRSSNNPFSMSPIKINKEDKPKKDGNLLNNIKNDISSIFTSTKEKKTNKTGEMKISHKNDTSTNNVVAAQLNSTIKENTQSTTKSANSTSENNLNISMNIKHEEYFNKSSASSNNNTSPNNLNLNLNDTKTNLNSQLNVSSQNWTQPTLKSGNTKLVSEISNNKTTNPQPNEYAPNKNQNETFEKDKSLVNKTHLELPMTNKSQQHVDIIQSKNKTNNNNQTNFSTEHNGKSIPHLKLNESNVEGFINNGNHSEKSITNSHNRNQTFKLNNTSSEVNRSLTLKNFGEFQRNNNNSFKGNGSSNGISDIAHNLLKNALEENKTISQQNKLDDGEKESIKTKNYTGAPMQNTSFNAPSAGHLETLDLNSSSHSPTNIGLRNNFNTSEETPLSTKSDIGSVGKNQSNTSLFQKSSTSGNQTRDTQIPPVKYPQNSTANSHDTPTSEGKLSSTPSASAISSKPNHSNGLLPTGTVSSLTKNSTSTSNGDAKLALNPQLNISSPLVLANPQIDHINHPITPSEVAGKVPSTTGEFTGSNRTLSLTNSSPTKASVGINNDISSVLSLNNKPKGIPSSPVHTNHQINTTNPLIKPHDKADGEVLPPRAEVSLKSVQDESTPVNRANSTSKKKLIPQPSSSPATSKNMSKVELVEGSTLTAAPSHDLNDKTINFPSNNSHTNPQINTTNPLITPHDKADGEVLPPTAAGSSNSVQSESTPVNRANSTSKKKLIPQPSSSPVTSKNMSKVELVEGSTLTAAPSHDLNDKTINFPSKNFPVSSASNDTSTITTPSGSMTEKYPNGVVNSTVKSNSLESLRNSSNPQGTTVNKKEGTVDVSTQGNKNNLPNHKSNESFTTTSNNTASRNNQSTSGMGNLNNTQRPIANKVIAQNTTHKSEKGNKNDVNGIPANITGTESLSEGYTGTQNAPTPSNILFLNQTNSLPKAENQLGNGFDPFKGLLGKNDGSEAGKGSSNKEGDLSNIPYTNDVSEEDDEIPYTNKVNSEDKIKGSDDDIVVMTESTVSSSGTDSTNKVETTEKPREVFPVDGTSRKSSKTTASPLPKDGKSTPTSAIIDETPFLINPKKTTTNPKVFDEKPFLINPEKNKAKPEVIDEHPFLINPKDRKPIKPTTTATTPLNNQISETTPDLQSKTVRTTSTENIESTTPTPIAPTANSTDADDKKDCENGNTLGGILGSALHYGALGGAAGAVGAMLPQILNMIKDLFKKDGGDDGNKKDDDNKTGGEGNQSEKQDTAEAQPEKTEDMLEKELSDAEDKVMDEIDDKIDNIEGSVVDTIKGKLTEVEDGVFEDLKQQILNGEGTMLQNVQAVVGGENNVFKNVKGRLIDVKDSLVADVKTSFKSAIENDEDLSKLTKLIHKDSVKMTKVGENCVTDNYRTNVQMLFINEKARTRRTSWPPTRNDYLGKVGSVESVDKKLGKAEQETDSPVTKDSSGASIEVNKLVVGNTSRDVPEVVTKTANVFGAFKKFMKN
ncbi:probable cyclin-dependent serine/threonine-protein kinase DDB_G0292550 [Coccinella septempunctata]|uniref:probable cyclin-dependent serine/threonine-protein kinase DDB_G0292550 n=1 Tax=Coccinella septempunctata TaxID=41139 RepID=UPI001D077662|nr:probable cyclin-dependent serine/threonine-protein kinase DDB_G0292550 [Coccinella septempunctata]